jgi:hypothetical protein
MVRITQLIPPDGAHILYGIPYRTGVNDEPQLWIENTRTHDRKMLLRLGSTLSARWPPDGTAFSLTEHWVSDRARAFIYNADTLGRPDLDDRILGADPEAARFTTGHSYFDVVRWADAQHVFVHFHGHTDEPPVVCFDLRFRVSRAGDVESLSQRVRPIDPRTFCRE